MPKFLQQHFPEINICGNNKYFEFFSNIKPSQLKLPKCTGKAEKANCLGYLLGYTDPVTVKSSTVMLPLHNICINNIKNELPIKVLRVACATWFFDILFQHWLK